MKDWPLKIWPLTVRLTTHWSGPENVNQSWQHTEAFVWIFLQYCPEQYTFLHHFFEFRSNSKWTFMLALIWKLWNKKGSLNPFLKQFSRRSFSSNSLILISKRRFSVIKSGVDRWCFELVCSWDSIVEGILSWNICILKDVKKIIFKIGKKYFFKLGHHFLNKGWKILFYETIIRGRC